MKTATVRLKQDKIGCEVVLKGVTPAELMFLIADNHIRAGGDPVMELTIEKKKVLGEVEERDPTGRVVLVDGKPHMIPGLVDSDEDNELNLSPSQERNRLGARFGVNRIKKFYPGPIPTLPQTFEEARQAGIGAEAPTERLLTVGDESGKQ